MKAYAIEKELLDKLVDEKCIKCKETTSASGSPCTANCRKLWREFFQLSASGRHINECLPCCCIS